MEKISTLLRGFVFLIIFISLLIFIPAEAPAFNDQQAIFAGGCFWCLEHDFESIEGVLSVESGYTGGSVPNPSYRQVSSETTGHQESVRVNFDPNKVSYQKLLRSYWRNVDPLDGQGQFCDRGDSYKPVIFALDDEQEKQAVDSLSKAALEIDKATDLIKVRVKPASRFWVAEDYHQDYAERNNLKYSFYRYSCGRDMRLEDVWGEKAKTDQEWSR